MDGGVRDGADDGTEGDIGREGDVDRAGVTKGGEEDAIDLLDGIVGSESGMGDGDLGVHALKDVEVRVAERMVEDSPAGLGLEGGSPDNVDDGDHLTVASGDYRVGDTKW
jgi:hypothetical protein